MLDAFSNLQNNNAQGEYYITDIVKWAVGKNLSVQSYILKNNEEIFGINSKIHLAQAIKILNKKSIEKLMEEGVQIVDPDTTYISPETTIGADTIILPNVYITGKNTIGKKCKIGPFSHVRDGAIIGNNVKIVVSIVLTRDENRHLRPNACKKYFINVLFFIYSIIGLF